MMILGRKTEFEVPCCKQCRICHVWIVLLLSVELTMSLGRGRLGDQWAVSAGVVPALTAHPAACRVPRWAQVVVSFLVL